MRSELELLGLTEGESKVYLALLELGSSLAGPIIKKTKLHRATTYQILQRLTEKGLVSFTIMKGKRHFEAADPEQFSRQLKEKQDILSQILPELKLKKSLAKQSQEITVYQGRNGIKTVCGHIIKRLSPGGTYYDFGVSGLFRDIMKEYWDKWQTMKQKNNIKAKVIFNESIRKNKYLLQDIKNTSYKFVPDEFYSSTDTMILDDTIILFIWTGQPPLAVMIKNKENAEGYKRQFNLMWKNAKK
ncbi:TrmB family transcriptional regulator [Candidatus Woesearchaeota archaeon]|jgi:HTH-type transcriptional regulator, sugar sensing transcriptional regulator|nr:TrmB family transcriptional regulator [Candidatus Woesearchaeota archaeon]MBT3537483.1 TrmB family transcriptional regulator [Candidatus Woesearchaeota archaeon]MBT4697248.1 TrmB family transcriptional regulator [Candidatus Woesearchaeota archaeon]MBT4717608.1 TrmB family transcriptional regulator [Candidatus Woesearchaeota archaeon]MBT7106207.1 TrmB family transcriptional regulator [Candidatus Woesearchaeota archaeon]